MLTLFSNVRAQKVAVKTNLISDVLLSPNLGVEVGLAPRWTIDVSGEINAWKINDHSWRHWFVQPEVRYWFCERFQGHFIGVHIHSGQYNVGGLKNGFSLLGTDFSKLSDRRYQGWFVGAGIAYGYAWILNKHWNLESEIGIGYSYTNSNVYPCAVCGKKLENNKPHHYVGLTKVAVNLVYTF